jgi:Flp pilus assembly protein TadG
LANDELILSLFGNIKNEGSEEMKTRTLLNDKDGTAIVEFAIVLPLLLIITLGIIEFSIALYDKAMITNASREGARTGIVFNVDSDGNWTPVEDTVIQNRVNNYLETYLRSLGDGNAAANTTITRAPDPMTGKYSPGGELHVSVTYRYTFLALPNFIADIINPINLTANTVMRFE